MDHPKTSKPTQTTNEREAELRGPWVESTADPDIPRLRPPSASCARFRMFARSAHRASSSDWAQRIDLLLAPFDQPGGVFRLVLLCSLDPLDPLDLLILFPFAHLLFLLIPFGSHVSFKTQPGGSIRCPEKCRPDPHFRVGSENGGRGRENTKAGHPYRSTQ